MGVSEGTALRGLLALASVVVFALLPAAARAQSFAPFGHTCTAENGVRFCPTTEAGAGRTADGVKTFDGIPLDVDVTLPASGSGPFPTIALLHGYGDDKTMFESGTPNGDGSITYHDNNVYYAQHGYAVLTFTDRGFGHSCGGGPTADHTGDCANGYIRLMDTRYEARDAQFLLGKLVDQGITKPSAIGVSGISYGGGESMELAFLRDRIRNADGSFSPWTSPNGTPLSIAAAWPRWPWSDLVSSLIPNGRLLDFDPSTNGLSRAPVGVAIQSYITGLFALGQTAGYYCGNPPATPCTDPNADLTSEFAEVTKGEPVDSTEQANLDNIFTYHGAFGLPLSSGGAAPLLIENGWTDDLFPPAEALRVYNELRQANPGAPVSLQFGDLGHSRGSNKLVVNAAFNDEGASFFAARLQGSGSGPAPGGVTAYTQTCPAAAPDGGPYSASSWPSLHPQAVTFGSAASQTVTSAGGAQDGPSFDPIAGTTDACTTVSGSGGPGTASYTLPSSGFTMLGLPTVTATIATSGAFGQLDSRLYDVMPNGSERLVTRGAYRLLDNQAGTITFQLHGNGYQFPPGDTVKLELRGNDAPYLRPSNGSFSVAVSNVGVSLPVPAAAKLEANRLRLSVTPARARAHRRVRFAFVVTTQLNGATVPVAGARVRLGAGAASTDSAGHASFRVRFARAGSHLALATKAGFSNASARVRVSRVRRHHARRRAQPRFTG